MTVRYFKCEVTKELASEIYLKVDDADPRYAEMFAPVVPKQPVSPEVLKLMNLPRTTPDVQALVQESAKELDSYDWEDNGISIDRYLSETTEKEANDYGVLDLTKAEG